MPLDKEKAQDLIDDFVLTNDAELHTIASQNPALFDATLNALNFLSSRFGTGEKVEIADKPLPFKNGDKFTVPKDKIEQFYTLEDIDLANDSVGVIWYNQKEGIRKHYKDSIKEVTKRFDEGDWVLVDWFPLKVGGKFLNHNNKNITFTITGIDNSGNTTKELEVVVTNNGVDKIKNYEIGEFIDDIELGFKIPIKETVLPFKVGDKFYDPNISTQLDRSNTIIKIDPSINYFEFENKFGSFLNGWTLEEAKENFKKGEWVLIAPQTQPTSTPVFQTGQIVWDKQQSELVIITDNNNNILDLISYRQVRHKNVDTLEEDIKLGASILLKFKIGDNYIDNNGNTYQIYSLTPNSATNVMVIKNGSNTSLLWEYIDNKIIHGEWKPLIAQQPQPQQFQPTIQATNNPNDIKIGDLIVTNPGMTDDKLWEVIDVNQSGVKLMTSSNKKSTIDLATINDKIDLESMQKLSFSIGSTFVTPNGDFFKIMELYPNNEKSIWVKVNDKPDLEVFQWDIIQDWIDDAYWMAATKAEADQIKADVLKAEEEAKAPKKKLTKLEKQIKDLQEEIDGLLFLADEDDEAKAELEKKLMQIEALKAKKP